MTLSTSVLFFLTPPKGTFDIKSVFRTFLCPLVREIFSTVQIGLFFSIRESNCGFENLCEVGLRSGSSRVNVSSSCIFFTDVADNKETVTSISSCCGSYSESTISRSDCNRSCRRNCLNKHVLTCSGVSENVPHGKDVG